MEGVTSKFSLPLICQRQVKNIVTNPPTAAAVSDYSTFAILPHIRLPPAREPMSDIINMGFLLP